MNRVLKDLSKTALTVLLLSLPTLALDSQYKNSLTKIELTKTNESSYNVNLYTQKKFQEPVKIIKKSDLNYYILLPETNNSVSQTAINTADIRNVSTNLYPYATSDINNGYTKININTTRPLNFTINVKNNSDIKTSKNTKTTVASNNQTAKTEVKENKVQKKNSDFSKNNTSEIKKDKKTAVVKNDTSKTTAKTALKSKKIEAVAAAKIQPEKKQIKTTKKEVKNTVKETKNTKKETQTSTQKEVQNTKTQTQTPQNNVKIEDIIQQEVQSQKNKIKEDIETNSQQPELNDEIKDTANGEIISLNELEKNLIPVYKDENLKTNFITKVKNKLSDIGISLKDALFLLFAGISTFFIMLLILNNKPEKFTLMRKSDFIDKTHPKNLKNKKDNGKYFVFDKNVKQTGFCDPATSAIKSNYELASYKPDTKEKPKYTSYDVYKNKQIQRMKTQQKNSEIIQRILKEDTYVEVLPKQDTVTTKETTVKPQQNATSPINKEQEKQIVLTSPTGEPVVVSNVKIDANHGFMCISYENNINLMGYIYDDVFAIYDFKRSKLDNYDIKFRLSDKDENGANYIVKLDNTKMLIKVTKNKMNLEMIM